MKLLRIKHVSDITGLSNSSIYKQMREGRFPKGISITKRAKGWREDSFFIGLNPFQKKLGTNYGSYRNVNRTYLVTLVLLLRHY
jgi:prophage regulatory protein